MEKIAFNCLCDVKTFLHSALLKVRQIMSNLGTLHDLKDLHFFQKVESWAQETVEMFLIQRDREHIEAACIKMLPLRTVPIYTC